MATLLLQPAATAPRVIVIDEPELGLHPVALSELAGMVKKAARHSQVVLSTQSPQLIDEFSAKEIRVVEMNPDSGASQIRALSESALSEWLKEYSPSELWEKNLIGGRP
ncbi:MAG: AAA family ATPase [Kiritimatiellae bacterium]|nr:AAA family ATPase [Kiritimatiellia bacterium]